MRVVGTGSKYQRSITAVWIRNELNVLESSMTSKTGLVCVEAADLESLYRSLPICIQRGVDPALLRKMRTLPRWEGCSCRGLECKDCVFPESFEAL